MKFKIALSALLVSGLAIAQNDDKKDLKDFGGLIKGGLFKITNEGTAAYNMTALGGHKAKEGIAPNDDIEYMPGNSPGRTFFRKWEDQRLIVKREKGVVNRVSQLSYSDIPDNKTAVTLTLDADGRILSRTECGQPFKKGFFNARRRDGEPTCRTVTPQVCEYVASKNLKGAFDAQITECGNLIATIMEHQGNLASQSEEDASANNKHIKELDKKIANSLDLFKYPTKTLNDLAEVTEGFDTLIADCEELKKNDALAPIPAAKEPNADDSTAAIEGTKKKKKAKQK